MRPERLFGYCSEAREEEIQALRGKFLEQIIRIITLMIDQVRFLFKDCPYREEQEYRLVENSESPQPDEAPGGGMPRLYIEAPVQMRYEQAILGPRVQNPLAAASYLLNLNMKDRANENLVVKKSAIHII